MMFFVTAFLWTLWLISIPILIALWNRRRFKKESFGGFYLLRRIAETTIRRIRLLEILKLLNRIALVSWIILIFAEPYKIERRIGEAAQGFVILLDTGRSLQVTTKEKIVLTSFQLERARQLLESLPSQSHGMLGFVSGRCEFARVRESQQTASPAEWIALLGESRIPYSNLETQTSALQSCLSRAAGLFAGKNIFKVFISPLPDTLDASILKEAGLHFERLPSPEAVSEEKVEIHQELRETMIRVQLVSGKAQSATLVGEGKPEPLGKLVDSIDLPTREGSVLLLEGEETFDPWSSRHLFPLQAELARTVTVWAQKETPGFLSLVSALRNHPQIRVQKQLGGQPQGEALIIYGSFPYSTEGFGRSLFFIDPQGQTSFPVRDKKQLSSAFSTADLIRAFQFQTPQGLITIRRYVLLDPDRFETLSTFDDGAPSLVRDRQSTSKHWVAPFDLEDLTTDLTLEAAFIPYLYTQIESWLSTDQESKVDQDLKPLYLFPGQTKPTPSVVQRMEWPGLYGGRGLVKVVKAAPLPRSYLQLQQDETQTNVQEEKVSFRSLFLKALAISVVIELLLCLATAPRLLALLGGFLFLMLGSVDAASLRPMSLGAWKGIDSDRRVSLGQLGQDADRLSNLEFEAPTEVTPTEFWKYPIVFHSSTSRLSPLSQEDQQRIRDYCERGGLIIFDDPLATTDSQFYQSVKNEMSKIFPGRDLKKISKEDVIFRTFYLLNEVSGRKLAAPYLEGISFDNRWVVLFSFNDLLGATFRTPRGDYGLSVTPYGISQRVLAQRLLVNFLMYGATIDYKDDAIHLPHILKRRVR